MRGLFCFCYTKAKRMQFIAESLWTLDKKALPPAYGEVPAHFAIHRFPEHLGVVE